MHRLVNARQNSPSNLLAVTVPVLSILDPAVVVISLLAMNEQNGKVKHVKVGDGGVEAGREGPREAGISIRTDKT